MRGFSQTFQISSARPEPCRRTLNEFFNDLLARSDSQSTNLSFDLVNAGEENMEHPILVTGAAGRVGAVGRTVSSSVRMLAFNKADFDWNWTYGVYPNQIRKRALIMDMKLALP
jgi:hypothetical protein